MTKDFFLALPTELPPNSFWLVGGDGFEPPTKGFQRDNLYVFDCIPIL